MLQLLKHLSFLAVSQSGETSPSLLFVQVSDIFIIWFIEIRPINFLVQTLNIPVAYSEI